jgi:hypothetical protein
MTGVAHSIKDGFLKHKDSLLPTIIAAGIRNIIGGAFEHFDELHQQEFEKSNV